MALEITRVTRARKMAGRFCHDALLCTFILRRAFPSLFQGIVIFGHVSLSRRCCYDPRKLLEISMLIKAIPQS